MFSCGWYCGVEGKKSQSAMLAFCMGIVASRFLLVAGENQYMMAHVVGPLQSTRETISIS